MNEIERIVDLLEREHGGEPWHGPSLLSILHGVDSTKAAARPLSGGHTIWELVLHIAAWKNEVRHRVSGAPAGEPEEGDWPAVGETTPAAWKAACDRLDLAHRLLISAVRDMSDAKLFEPINDPRGEHLAVTYYGLLHGAVQHDTYHSGQIAILKKGVTT